MTIKTTNSDRNICTSFISTLVYSLVGGIGGARQGESSGADPSMARLADMICRERVVALQRLCHVGTAVGSFPPGLKNLRMRTSRCPADPISS